MRSPRGWRDMGAGETGIVARLSSSSALISVSERDRRGLEWVKMQARSWLTQAKRRRKYRPPGPYTEDEMALFSALIEMERAAKALLNIEGGSEI